MQKWEQRPNWKNDINKFYPPIKVKLTENEVYSINKVWGKLGKKIDFRYWQFYKKLGMFNASMVPENLYVGYIIRTLNPLKLSKCLQNKNHYPLLFRELKQPEVVVNCIRGCGIMPEWKYSILKMLHVFLPM